LVDFGYTGATIFLRFFPDFKELLAGFHQPPFGKGLQMYESLFTQQVWGIFFWVFGRKIKV
jgi:hypothetical protein